MREGGLGYKILKETFDVTLQGKWRWSILN